MIKIQNSKLEWKNNIKEISQKTEKRIRGKNVREIIEGLEINMWSRPFRWRKKGKREGKKLFFKLYEKYNQRQKTGIS